MNARRKKNLNSNPKNSSLIAVLLDIRSLHNVGSMFRTADGAGVELMYLCGITPAPIDRFGRMRKEVSKVALGAENEVAWKEYRSSSIRLLKKLKKDGYKIVAVEQYANSIIYPAPVTGNHKDKKVCICLGAEVEGLPEKILKEADSIIEIPMRGSKESLNVSVAFGIVAYHVASEIYKTSRR